MTRRHQPSTADLGGRRRVRAALARAAGAMLVTLAATSDLSGATPTVQLPVPLFQTHLATGINVLGFKRRYAVSRDGRFLLDTTVESVSAPIVMSVNWMKKIAR